MEDVSVVGIEDSMLAKRVMGDFTKEHRPPYSLNVPFER